MRQKTIRYATRFTGKFYQAIKEARGHAGADEKENEALSSEEISGSPILSVERDKVKLGVEAPVSMRIFREEIIRKTARRTRSRFIPRCFTFDLRFPEDTKKRVRKNAGE
jgi:carbon storage regulator CsrA